MTGVEAEIFFQRVQSDPYALLDAIDSQLALADPLDLPMVSLGKDGGRSVKQGRPVHVVLDAVLTTHVAQMRTFVCETGDYCARSRKFKNTIDLMKAVNDSLVSAAMNLPLPVATVAAYCVQSLFLDRLCACEQHAASGG